MTISLAEIARLLNGDVVSGGVSFPSPGHSPRDRSGRILLGPHYPDGFWVESFAGDDPLRIRDFVRDRLGLPHALSACPPPLEMRTSGQARHDPERSTRALALWAEARQPHGTPVESYLGRRGLALSDAAGEAIRFHPSCPFGDERTPAMVCLVQDAVTNEPRAIHRTALNRAGYKIKVCGSDRLTLGPVKGGAVKLTPDEQVTTCLGIGEGVESTLSLQSLPEFGPSPVWSLLSADGVERFPVLAGIECLWIAVDHDASGRGQRAARTCAERWRAAGREAFFVKPTAQGRDLNDIVTGRSRHA